MVSPDAHERGDEADVGAVARREEDAGFLVLEARELGGELLVDVEGAGEDRRARGAEAVLLDRLGRRLLHLRPVRDAEVVVGGQVERSCQRPVLPFLHADVGRRAPSRAASE